MSLAETLLKDYVETSFEKHLQKETWGNCWGLSNSIGQIRKVLVHRPGNEILRLRGCRYDEQAGALVLRDGKGRIRSYCKAEQPPDLALMQRQHDRLTAALRENGAEVIEMESMPTEWTNMLFPRDAAMIVPHGAVLSRFSMFFRQGETPAIQRAFGKIGMPILGAVQGAGCAEGGSFAMLDPQTAVIGRSARVNREGTEQVRRILAEQGVQLVAVDLPANRIHLDSVFLQLDRDKALVDPSGLPQWFLDFLRGRGIDAIPLDLRNPPLTNNCIPVCPGKVIFPATGLRTMDRLSHAGVEVIPVDVSELNKMGGGIHCSTLELIRDDI